MNGRFSQIITKQWYGCPKCESSNYRRKDHIEIDGVRILFYCPCGYIFYNPLLYWLEEDCQIRNIEDIPRDMEYQDYKEFPDFL
jgi:hypothetical protein